MRLMSVLLCLCLLFSGCCYDDTTSQSDRAGFVLIDPGHGGMDGGSVAPDGICEKHLNLSISLVLRDLLVLCGIPTIMTRETDVSLHNPGDTTIRNKKVSDMQNRLTLYNQANAVISIHQNYFTSSKYYGAQIFYSANHPASVELASHLQQAVVKYLQPDNQRELKSATDGIYLLSHCINPTVLVECGFLSNPEEYEKLKTTEYQQQLSLTLLSGYLNYSNTK